jgi:hypothetical protein
MVVHDFNVPWACRGPYETDTELIVDSNTVLSAPVSLQRFEPIARRDAQVEKVCGPIQHCQLSHRDRLDADKRSDSLSAE